MKSNLFAEDEELKKAVSDLLDTKPKTFYSDAFRSL
jgi:hypothetical protein